MRKAQATRYLGELEVGCQTLSDNPPLGRRCDEVRSGLRRLEHGASMSCFYRQERAGILVLEYCISACCDQDDIDGGLDNI